MKVWSRQLTRREFVLSSSVLLTSAVARAGPNTTAAARDLSALDVAYAGSMGSIMEGPLRAAAARTLKLELHGRGQGSSALAQLIVGGSIRPDVFVPITPEPMRSVLRAGRATLAKPIAHTEMVIAYSPKSRFASKFDAVKGTENCWEILRDPGLRFGRTDPVTDPQGRNIIFTMMLAAKRFKQSDLVERVLGPTINDKQIFSESTVQARLQSGQLDAASAYKIQPGPFHLPYVTLPKEINLSGQDVQSDHPDMSLTVGGKTYKPEPLIYYVAVLKDASNPNGAMSFAEWLRGSEAQAIFKRFYYDPPSDAASLAA